MVEQIDTFSKEEFLALIMEYASHAELDMTDEERKYIIDKVGYQSYQKADKYYGEHGDYQVVQDIIKLQKKFFPGENGIRKLHNYLVDFFMMDGKFTVLERVFDDVLEKLFD